MLSKKRERRNRTGNVLSAAIGSRTFKHAVLATKNLKRATAMSADPFGAVSDMVERAYDV